MRKLSLALLGLLLLPLLSRGDEGMWLLPLLQKYNLEEMREMGYKLDASYLYSEEFPSLKDAIVRFGRGCTGEFISYKGLVLTNHHCGYGAIQQHSSVEHDYLKEGFWAKSFEEEIPTPGLSVTILMRMQDVTQEMLRGVSDTLNMMQRDRAMKATRDSLVKAATEGTKYSAEVKSFYNENVYYLLVYNVFRDVRMVGAPPSSIGKFGGETDNWMYPRHTGDFSLFRVYADKNNEPAEYSKDNVPYKPRRALAISIGGYKEGDFAMIMGNPGRTNRSMSSWEVQQTIDIRNKALAEVRGVKLAVWKKFMEANPAVRIKYAAKYAQSSNYWKNSIGQSIALQKLNVVKEKQKEELNFYNWATATPERRAKYGDVLKEVERTNTLLNPIQLKQHFSTETFFRGMEFISHGRSYSRLRKALTDKDTATLNRYQRGANAPLEETFYKDYDPETDRETTKALLKYYKENLPDSIHPPLYQTIAKEFKGNIDAYVDKLFATSFLTDYARWKAFMKSPNLKKLDTDLGYLAMESTLDWTHKEMNYAAKIDMDFAKAMMRYTAGRLEMLGEKPSYPDANSTMRLSYGTVKSYSPRDAVHYKHYTTFDGVMEKDNPASSEFAVPEKLKTLYTLKQYDHYKNAEGELPVAFITTNDITGGNSGSPVLNANGSLIGCAFDGNWEALSGDIAFEKVNQRSINVDIRYVLFVIHKYAESTRLIDEMQIVRE